MTMCALERDVEMFSIEIIENPDREKVVRRCERRLLWYKKGYEQLVKNIGADKAYESELIDFVEKYNACVNEFYCWCERYTDVDFEFCSNETLVGESTNEN